MKYTPRLGIFEKCCTYEAYANTNLTNAQPLVWNYYNHGNCIEHDNVYYIII